MKKYYIIIISIILFACNNLKNKQQKDTNSTPNAEAITAETIDVDSALNRISRKKSETIDFNEKGSIQNNNLKSISSKGIYDVEGIITNLDFQGQNYLQISIDGVDGNIHTLWCTGGTSKFNWTNLKNGMHIGANGEWLDTEEGKQLEPTTLKILN
jgi:hypothetical protein